MGQSTIETSAQNKAEQALTDLLGLEAEKKGFEPPDSVKVLTHLYLRLKSKSSNDLARLVDVLKLHGFLLSHDGH